MRACFLSADPHASEECALIGCSSGRSTPAILPSDDAAVEPSLQALLTRRVRAAAFLEDEAGVQPVVSQPADSLLAAPTTRRRAAVSFFGNFPPMPPMPTCTPSEGECKLMPLPFQSAKLLNKGHWPFGKRCINVDGLGLQYGDAKKGYVVGDPRTIVWEESPKCAKEGKVRIHFVDGEASLGMDNKPEDNEDDSMKHTYHAMTFITISDDNRRKFRDAMVHKECVDSPMRAIMSEWNPLKTLRNAGGPDITKPMLMFMPSDELDYTSFEIANHDVGGDCEA
eukprot:TRINITY_DN124262_c0_g1_i1.p1 TRINITY_DN124262_c0_g1~~TRINITY_DN124262_c0_g1_i1.p1  ORF type:complete len:282 (-),score=54.58 TRINITY_DN124262_c0_g1_i1:69-914(-)